MLFKLSGCSAGLGLNCDENGLSLAGVPLLSFGEHGFQPRPMTEIHLLLKAAYRTDEDFSDRQIGLAAVARALNSHDLAQASISAVLLKLPELDWEAAVRIARANDEIAKYDPEQPRDDRGRWTATDSDASAAASEGLSSQRSEVDVSVVPVREGSTPRSRDQCIADCTDLTLGAAKLPPGCTGSREWEFRRCLNTCLGIGEPWPQWVPFFPPQRFTPVPSPSQTPKITPKPWWFIPLLPFPGNPLYGGA